MKELTDALAQLGYRIVRMEPVVVNGPPPATDDDAARYRAVLALLRAALPVQRGPKGRLRTPSADARVRFLGIWDGLPQNRSGLRARLVRDLGIHSSSISRWRPGRS